jgi:hypothetical protein
MLVNSFVCAIDCMVQIFKNNRLLCLLSPLASLGSQRPMFNNCFLTDVFALILGVIQSIEIT